MKHASCVILRSTELMRRGFDVSELSMSELLQPDSKALTADLERLLLAHIVDERPYVAYDLVRATVKALPTATSQRDVVTFATTGTTV
jgi:hypothetical protein